MPTGMAGHRMRVFQNSYLTALLLVGWVLFVVWVFGLPTWANLLNNKYWDIVTLASPQGLCSVPPSMMKCYDSSIDFAELAAAAGRGAGCSCGQGILGEPLCALTSAGFSVSSFIATAFGTGTMAAVSVVPIGSMWWAHAVFVEQLAVGDNFIGAVTQCALVAFQIGYLLFLMFPCCVWGDVHLIMVGCFVVSGAAYWLLIAYHSLKVLGSVQVAGIIFLLSMISVISLIGGVVCYTLFGRGILTWPYGFWLGECIGLSSGIGIAPALVLFGRVGEDSQHRA